MPDFEGKVDATQFVDWLAAIEEYFDWYDMTDDRRVRFSKMKLVGLAKIWWTGVEGDIRRMGLSPINTWEEMRQSFGRNTCLQITMISSVTNLLI